MCRADTEPQKLPKDWLSIRFPMNLMAAVLPRKPPSGRKHGLLKDTVLRAAEGVIFITPF